MWSVCDTIVDVIVTWSVHVCVTTDVTPSAVHVGNIVQGARLAWAHGRDVGYLDEDSEGSKKVCVVLLWWYMLIPVWTNVIYLTAFFSVPVPIRYLTLAGTVNAWPHSLQSSHSQRSGSDTDDVDLFTASQACGACCSTTYGQGSCECWGQCSAGLPSRHWSHCGCVCLLLHWYVFYDDCMVTFDLVKLVVITYCCMCRGVSCHHTPSSLAEHHHDHAHG